MLELYATRGLAQEAVHVTKLALGEGLVGTIAEEVEMLNLDEAAVASRFRLQARNRRGELPQLRRRPDHPPRTGGRACSRSSTPTRAATTMLEIEALQTVAMVLSELIANAGPDRRAAAAAPPARNRPPRSGCPGRSWSTAWRAGTRSITSRAIVIEHTVAEDTEAERHRVYAAFDKMREQIERMTAQAEFGGRRRA